RSSDLLSENYKFFKIYSVLLFVFLTVIFSYLSYYNANKYKDADIFWKNAYADAENYHVACQGLAKRYLYSGNYSKAKELLFKAKKLKNLYDYDLDIASVSITEGNFDEAENRLLRLIKLKENFIALKYLSEIYFVKGDIEKSHVYAEKAFKLNPNDKRLTEHIKKLQSQSLNN
ncbi:MAG: tetratricopeptide repeat protein, partial [Endomicrobiaceae bacterium]